MPRGRPRKTRETAPRKGGFQYVPDELVIWKPKDPGDKLVGLVTSKGPGKFGVMVRVKDEDGVVWVLPAHKVLESRLGAIPDPPGITPGHTVLEIEFTHRKRTRKGGSETEFYKVGYRGLEEGDVF